jgi:hypothetical protein
VTGTSSDQNPEKKDVASSIVDAARNRRLFSAQILSAIWRWGYLGVIVASALIYWGALRGGYIWEDPTLIRDGAGSLAQTFTKPFLTVYFRPLVSLTFWIDHHLFHEDTFMYHQTNILIHALTTAVLIALLRAAIGRRSVALIGGLLFAVQPAQVSTVAWIGGRTDSLCTLMVSLYAWTLVLGARNVGRRRAATLAVSAVCFLLAMLAKEQALALLPLAPFAFWCFGSGNDGRTGAREKGETGRRLEALIWIIPFILAALVFLFLAFRIGPGLPTAASHGPVYRIELCGRSITYYALLLAVPSARWMHSVTVMSLEEFGFITVLTGYALLGTAVFALISLTKRAAIAAWFLAFTLLPLFPVSNILPVSSLIVAPFRAGIAGLGAAALMAYAMVRLVLWCSSGSDDLTRMHLRSSAAVLGSLLFFGWCSWLVLFGADQFSDELGLYTTFVRNDPASTFAREGLINRLITGNKGRLAESNAEEFLAAIFRSDAWRSPRDASAAVISDPAILDRMYSSNGDKRTPRQALGDIFVLLGLSRWIQKDRAGSLIAYRCGEAIDPLNPGANLGIGRWFASDGRWKESIPNLQTAARVAPRTFVAHMILAEAYINVNEFNNSIYEFRAAIRLQPWDGDVYARLAGVQTDVGDRAGAIRTLEDGRRRAVVGNELIAKKLSEIRRLAPSSHFYEELLHKRGYSLYLH